MPLPPVPNGAKATIIYNWDGQVCENTMWFVGGATPVPTGDLIALADGLLTWATDVFMPNLSEQLVLLSVRVQDMSVVAGGIVDRFASDVFGGITGESVPNNVDPAVTFRTAVGGRSGHGRNYIPGFANSQVTGNFIETAAIGALTGAYNALLPGGTNDPTPMVWSIVSYFTAGAPRVVPFSWPVTTVGFTDNVVDSQRRRLPFRGR